MNDHEQDQILRKARTRGGLRGTLLRWFLVFALLPLILVSVVSYTNAKGSLRDAASSTLQEASALRTAFIENWFSYRFLDLEAQATSVNNVRFIKELGEAFRSSGKNARDFVGTYEWATIADERGVDLKTFRRLYGYSDVFLIDSEGNILFTVKRESDLGTNLFDRAYSRTLFAQACKKAFETGRPGFSDFEFYAPSNNAVAGFLASVIVDDDGEKVGLIAFQISVDKVDGIMQERAGLGITGETYLVGADLMMRSDSIHEEQDTILTRRMDSVGVLKWHEEHITKEGEAEDGGDTVLNYAGPRGEQVLGICSNIDIAGVSWGLIAEIEETEAFASVTRLQYFVLALLAGTGLVVVMLVVPIVGQIVGPIRELSRVTKLVAAGDLD